MSDPFIGEIRMVGFNFAPRGWALCQGQVMSIAQNNALFALLGTLYGGNGQTTFGLPDFRGRGPVGQGQGPGLSDITIGELSGVENVTILSTQMPIHSHTATPASNSISASGQASIPAATTGTTQATPGPTTVLGPVSAAGRAGTLYATGTADTNLAPFNVSVLGDMPGITIGNAGGSQPLGVRNPYLGTNFVIALEGVFPSRN
ncbi:tail fiber protein [Pseudomonas sp. LA21]|uniref:phage tail protein n=1 Tax=unclassified Pseudomonas TaxID=196821 RepID=UPI001A9EF014|nr:MULTISPECIES: tail fiber protein [unclassified Pseudomonas]MCJ1886617.1 tail fiber protein [Pseudomonas sp. LA21]